MENEQFLMIICLHIPVGMYGLLGENGAGKNDFNAYSFNNVRTNKRGYKNEWRGYKR